MSTRNNINVSFPEEDTTMYKDIILESSFTDVQVATLSRKYMKLVCVIQTESLLSNEVLLNV